MDYFAYTVDKMKVSHRKSISRLYAVGLICVKLTSFVLILACTGGGGDDNGSGGTGNGTNPSIEITNAALLEGNSGVQNLTFQVLLSQSIDEVVTVDYVTMDNTATTGSDYSATSGTLSFVPGETNKEINVSVNGDDIVEGDEDFYLILSHPSTNASIATTQAVGTILNDDLPKITISDGMVTEGDDGITSLIFNITLSAAVGEFVTIEYVTIDGTAVGGSDYNTIFGTLNFDPWETQVALTVEILGDTEYEAEEVFTIELSNPSVNAELQISTANGRIVDDDAVMLFDKHEITFAIPQIYNNPFDTDEVAIDVDVALPDGSHVLLPAFYNQDFEIVAAEPERYGNGSTPNWKARFTPSQVGEHVYTITLTDGDGSRQVGTGGRFTVVPSSNKGFIRIDARDGRFMQYDNGQPFIPIGHNVAWEDGTGIGLAFWDDYFGRMAANGANWTRIHLIHYFEGQSLEWIPNYTGYYHGLGRYSLELAWKIDRIIESAARHGIAIQLALHNAIIFSTTIYPQWHDNPYNIANADAGGFLLQPGDFFNDAQAINLLKRKLRYFVARWAYSPAILCWEIFNEVQFVDGFRESQSVRTDAIDWHAEISEYLRDIDPFGHLITTSSAEEERLDPVWELADIDMIQFHNYEPNKISSIKRQIQRLEHIGKPVLVGEFGAEDQMAETVVESMPEPERTQLYDALIMHNGIWTAAMLNSGAMLWWWDSYIHTLDLYHVYAPLAYYWEGEDPAAHGLVSVTPQVSGVPTTSGLSATPGLINFDAPSTQTAFTVTDDDTVPGIEYLSIWLHGTGHENLRSDPIFTVTLSEPGNFSISVEEVSPYSAAIAITVDGNPVFSESYSGAETNFTITVPLNAGVHLVQVLNTGNDYFKISSYNFEGLSIPIVATVAQASSNHAYIWAYDRGSQYHMNDHGVISGAMVKVSDLNSGTYQIEFWQTRQTGGLISTVQQATNGNTLTVILPDFEKDIAIKIKPQI